MGECIRVAIERVKKIWARNVGSSKNLEMSCERDTGIICAGLSVDYGISSLFAYYRQL
jgi:hypothetical protein